MKWAVAFVPLLFSGGTAAIIVYRYSKRVSVAWACVFFLAWAVLQGAGFLGLALAFDRHTSLIAAVLALLWLAVSVFLFLRYYYLSMGTSIAVIAAYTFAASHALHSRYERDADTNDVRHTDTYGLLAAFLDILAAVWAVVTICFSFSLLLHSAANYARMRRQTQRPQAQQPQRPVAGEMPARVLQKGANIFMGYMRNPNVAGAKGAAARAVGGSAAAAAAAMHAKKSDAFNADAAV